MLVFSSFSYICLLRPKAFLNSSTVFLNRNLSVEVKKPRKVRVPVYDGFYKAFEYPSIHLFAPAGHRISDVDVNRIVGHKADNTGVFGTPFL